MEKSSKLLKVVSILMIIFGSIALLLGIFALIGAMALMGGALGLGTEFAEAVAELILVAAVLTLVGAVIQFVAGIVGVKNHNKPDKAKVCIIFGILVALVQLISIVLDVAGGGFTATTGISIVIGLVIPVLYLLGAFQLKKLGE